MAAPCFVVWNGNMPTSGALTHQATGTSIRVMLQIATSSTKKIRVVEWGYGFDSAPTNNVKVELIESDTAQTSLTAHGSAGVMPYNDANGGTSSIQLGAALTAFNSTAPTFVAAVNSRLLDYQYENGLYFKKQFPLGREPEVGVSKFLQIRTTSTATTNFYCYVVFEE